MATIAPEVPVLARDEAFEQLYRRYVKDVYHYALALVRNPADAEDLTQTTFLNAYRAFQRGEEIRKPQNWLIKIAHNVARSRYARTSRRVREVPLEDHVDQLAVPEEERPNVQAVLRALGRLPFNQRAALVMRELEGRSYAEIADTLGVSVAAVETLIFRARRSLRIRVAAIRSLLSVPLPGSLSQFFDGGGAAAGGIGAGLLLKTAVALVIGGLATGAGVERVTQAAASPHPVASAASGASAGVGRALVRAVTSAPVSARAHAGRSVAARGRALGAGITRRASLDRAAGSAPAAAPSRSSDASASAPPVAAAPAQPPVTDTAANAVQPVAEAAGQVVATVSAATPVSVPQVPPLPVQPPPLPKLP
jgi:RNA polymerase sigma factor (sigma-70 family)